MSYEIGRSNFGSLGIVKKTVQVKEVSTFLKQKILTHPTVTHA